jgi:hypothetical protein
MEKRGEVFNQLAIIADLLENINLESTDTSVIFVLKKPDFDRIFDKIIKKTKVLTPEMLNTTFSMKIGEVNFVFSLSKD